MQDENESVQIPYAIATNIRRWRVVCTVVETGGGGRGGRGGRGGGDGGAGRGEVANYS